MGYDIITTVGVSKTHSKHMNRNEFIFLNFRGKHLILENHLHPGPLNNNGWNCNSKNEDLEDDYLFQGVNFRIQTQITNFGDFHGWVLWVSSSIPMTNPLGSMAYLHLPQKINCSCVGKYTFILFLRNGILLNKSKCCDQISCWNSSPECENKVAGCHVFR